MKATLRPGIRHSLRFAVGDAKTVPALYPESASFQAMPPVFATGFMVGFIEWACIEAIAPHLDEGEQSLGTHIDVSHVAATPVGFGVTAEVELERVEGRRLWFRVTARDDDEVIGEGRHERMVIDAARFAGKIAGKTAGKTAAAQAGRVAPGG
jgi:fluoroacetyl-CoA thioesterase